MLGRETLARDWTSREFLYCLQDFLVLVFRSSALAYDAHLNSRSEQSFRTSRSIDRHVNRERSAEGRLQGIGPVGNSCKVYRASLSLSSGQALWLNMRTFGVCRSVSLSVLLSANLERAWSSRETLLDPHKFLP